MVTLVIAANRIGPVLGRHPWVFSRALVKVPEGLVPGEPVRLVGQSGDFLAAGYFSSYSQISVRLWGYDPTEEVDRDFFVRRVQAASLLREQCVAAEDTDAYRLVHGENDLLPGLIVDRYGDYLVVQFHTRGIERWKTEILAALEEVCKPEGIYERSDVAVRHYDDLSPAAGPLSGSVPDLVAIREHGLKFLVDIKGGQKTGFFLDQRDKRAAFRRYARDKSVLNCFSYTGGFSVYALAGGARRVVNVDSSGPALDLARKNVILNGFDLSCCDFVAKDVKAYFRAGSEEFDAVVLDPPAFVKDRRKKAEGLSGYRTLNEMALRRLRAGGILLSCSCSAHLTMEEFRYLLSEAAGKTNRTLQILETFTHGPDHPQLAPFTEGTYLKAVIARVSP